MSAEDEAETVAREYSLRKAALFAAEIALFYDVLVKSGIEPEIAARLTERYMDNETPCEGE